MRKFSLLTLLVALFATFTANADYYLIGGFNGWTQKDSKCKFTSKGNGVYELNYKGTLTSGFKVNDGGWDNGVNFGSNGSNLVVGTAYKYVNGSNDNIEMDGPIDNPTVTLNTSDGTLLVEGTAGQSVITYALHGIFTSGWADVELTENATTKAWENASVSVTNSEAEFGVKKLDNGAQIGWWAASSDVTVNATTTLTLTDSNATNIKIATGTYSFSLDPSTKKLTITKAEGGSNPGTAEHTVAIAGAFNSWSPTANATSEIVDNCGTIVVESWSNTKEGQSAGFKYIVDGTWYGKYVEGESAYVVKNNTWCKGDANGNDDNMELPESAVGKTVTFTISVVDKTMKAVWEEEGVDPDTPKDTYSIAGAFNSWNVQEYETTVIEHNCVKFDIKNYKNAVEEQGEGFKFVVNGTFAGVANGTTVAVGAENWYKSTDSEGNVNISLDGCDGKDLIITYAVDTKDFNVMIDKESGIFGIFDDAEDVEYYNINGVRVQNPKAGLYIVRQGNKTSKVVIR